MKIIYLHRNPDLGFSLRRVFEPIIKTISKNHDVAEITMHYKTGAPLDVYKNIKAVRKIVKRNPDTVFHVTGDVHYLLIGLIGCKSVVTVHDIGLMKSLKNPKRFLYKLLRIITLKLARRVVFISEYSKKEVLKYVNLDKNKIFVIPNPVFNSFERIPKKFSKKKPIILHIGTRPHKNLLLSLKALRDIECHFRIIGQLDTEQVEQLKNYKIDYSNAYDLTDEEIQKEYINCDIVNFPSLHEGFGMPIIEGQSIGRVVITSDISPMNEVSGEGALLVNPYDESELTKAYKRIIEDELYRNFLIDKGFMNIEKYAVNKLVSVYEKLYESL